ncbi:hypothetical protein FS749_004893 [Ceratobasidium sp. UAMH 11750]|nr:hypothetical protein FS749_004893 [Ceratobasidium sp. UAMH 11750]
MHSKSGHLEASGKMPFLVAEYNGRKATVPRSPSYKSTVAYVKRAFRPLRSVVSDDIEICAWFEEHDDVVRITEELWAELLPRLKLVKILLEASETGLITRDTTMRSKEMVKVVVSIRDLDKRIPVLVSLDSTVARFYDKFCEKQTLCTEGYRLLIDGDRPSENWTLRECGVESGQALDLVPALTGGKPVIYLFPPALIPSAHVKLSLTESWTFSALYPPTNIISQASTSAGQSVSWTVDAKPDGTLFDYGSQREVSYLFWEARTNPVEPPSPIPSQPSSPSQRSSTFFDPARPEITPADSVLLPFDKVTGYIDDALISLGLHSEARTSFITYWLPALQRHSYVALRFLPQNEYEAAASMSVTPIPDVTTRVFMLFRGVKENELETWAEAHARGARNASIWYDVVGVDLARARDASLFRVLEWGGMEVK